MEVVIAILGFIVVMIIWIVIRLALQVGVTAASKAVYKATEPKDTLKKVERDAKRESQGADIDREEYIDMQKFGVCFARFAILVASADGLIEEVELNEIASFFSNAHPLYIDRVMESVARDLKKPDKIDWEYNLATMKSLLSKSLFKNYDSVIFHGLINIAGANGEIDESEINVIVGIMMQLGWTQEQISSYLHFYYQRDETEVDEDTLKQRYLSILGLQNDASIGEIKKRYHSLVIEHHPDKFAIMGESMQRAAEEKMKTINVAYSGLKEMGVV